MSKKNIKGDRGSIIVTRNVRAGTVVDKKMLGIDLSTDEGISPRLLGEMVGKKIIHDLKKGSILTFGFIEP